MSKKAAIYLRVSTDKQTTDNQRIELEDIATRSGWDIVEVYEDKALSGAKGRDQRPAFDALHKDAAQRKFDIVMVWSVDRLGRSLQDLVAFLSELEALNIDLFLHQQSIDTTTPAGKMLYRMLGVFAEFEREMIRERVNAGLARAKAAGKTLGRPALSQEVKDQIHKYKAEGLSMRKIAKEAGVGLASVHKVLKEVP